MVRNKLVSVITPVLNANETIERLVRSICAQSYRPLELVIVDGGSEDGTLGILDSLKAELDNNNFKLRVLRERDFARNRSFGTIRKAE